MIFVTAASDMRIVITSAHAARIARCMWPASSALSPRCPRNAASSAAARTSLWLFL